MDDGADDAAAGVGGTLTLDDRRTIVDQALVLVEQNYVHLPLKRAMHAIEPVQALRLLRDRLAGATDATMGPEASFHAAMLRIFASIRDLHTSYTLPAPYASIVTYLPFRVEEYRDDAGARRFQVAHVVPGFDHDTFVPGVEVVSWSGVPIDRAVDVNADRHAGGNDAARRARGIEYLTLRPLVQALPPDEAWVEVGYVDLAGVERSLRHDWVVLDIGAAERGIDADQPGEAALALGLDRELDVATTAKRLMFAPKAAAAPPSERDEQVGAGGELPTTFHDVLRARVVPTSHGDVGHLRIFSFNVEDPAAFVTEVARLVDALPPTMLIVDVRGNGGGHIYASEGLLQLFTPRRITPEPTQFIVSDLNRRLCARHRDNRLGIDLSPWLASIEQAVRTGAVYSSGHPITPDAFANSVGQRYSGRVACVTDARCYSATDIFAAGFQDHQIGPVVGIDDNTGAGGANVWTHGLLRALLDQPAPPDRDSPYRELPKGASIQVAVRRTLRVHARAGTPLEDLGVEPDVLRHLTRNDLLNGNEDLIEFVAGVLAARQLHTLELVPGAVEGDRRWFEMTTSNLDRVDVLVGGRPERSIDVADGSRRVSVPATADDVRCEGWYDGQIVVSTRVRSP